MKFNQLLIFSLLASVTIGGCGEKAAQEKSPTVSTAATVVEGAVKAAVGVVQMSPPFDEMHLIFCEQHKNQAVDSGVIRLSELVLEQQRLTKEAMAANDLTKMQQLVIMAAKALNTEDCK